MVAGTASRVDKGDEEDEVKPVDAVGKSENLLFTALFANDADG